MRIAEPLCNESVHLFQSAPERADSSCDNVSADGAPAAPDVPVFPPRSRAGPGCRYRDEQPAGLTQQGSRRTRVNPIRVMVVDDSVVVRKIVTDVLSADPGIEVVGTAVHGRIAVAKLGQLTP